MNPLQKALLANALFSGASGILMISLHQKIASLFEIQDSTAFWAIGIALIYFALTIVYEIKKQRRLAVLWIIAQDMLWVVGSIIVLLAEPFGISSAGNKIIFIIALVVFAMAANQYRALKKPNIMDRH
ncbi:MAG: hypothetical protein WD048_07450 [Chitinophagales bacterium]